MTVWRSGDRLYGKAPTALHGLMEVRSVGVIAAPTSLRISPIAMVVDLAAAPERLPDPATVAILGMDIPRLTLPLDDPHAPLRLRAALAAVRHGL